MAFDATAMKTRTIIGPGIIFAAGMLAGVGVGLGPRLLPGADVLAAAPAAPRMSAQVILDVVSDELREPRTNVRVHVDTWPPGAETGRHDHPGPALLYVLEGQLEELNDGTSRALRPGQAVWERARTPHNVRNRTERPARALAVHLDPRP